MERPDLLHHWKAIAAHIGVNPDAARHLSKTAGLPVFKMGSKTVCASREALDQWLKKLASGGSTTPAPSDA